MRTRAPIPSFRRSASVKTPVTYTQGSFGHGRGIFGTTCAYIVETMRSPSAATQMVQRGSSMAGSRNARILTSNSSRASRASRAVSSSADDIQRSSTSCGTSAAVARRTSTSSAAAIRARRRSPPRR
jgi:hypothetical protein